ncbi:hypothetical protein BG006_004534 [Podila minutissima]|uniref:Nuclear segregation protein BFR1 n=1 Tax=Podila minutissima TaxID=64525 RepID=A0A9P5SNQ4_9FUNG|nr:hypothetical protein BG006_004534 [Podila minutissima]
MSILDTPRSSTQAAAATTIKKTTRVVVRKPNLDDKNNAIKELDAKIDDIRPRLNAVRDAIMAMTPKPEADSRSVLRKRLGELRDQQNENKKGKQAKVDKLNTLNNNLKKKIADLKVLQDKLTFKTTEAVEAQIRKLEKQVEKGSLKLVEEKKILSEISTLKKSKKSVEVAQAQQAAIDADKVEIAALKDTIDDAPARELSIEYNKVQAALDDIGKVKDQAWKRRNELFDERTRLQRELDAEFQRKKTVNDEYFAAVREHAKFLQDEQVRKREDIQHRKQQELEEKRLAIAREERELAEIPAFEAEITTCDSVYKYLVLFSNDQKRIVEATADTVSTAAVNSSNIRQVDTAANVPSGVMLRKKSEKVEDVYHVGAKSKKVKGPKEKNGSSSLKLPLAVVEQLVDLKIVVPTSPADLGKTLDALAEKRDHYRANQAKVTAENKRKAEERIAKLTLADVDSTEAIVQRTEVAHEIEAAACK